MSFFASVILGGHASAFPSVSRGETFAFGACHAPKGFIVRFLPKVIVPIQFYLFGRGILFGNAVIRARVVISRTAINAVSTGPLPTYQTLLAVMIVIAVP